MINLSVAFETSLSPDDSIREILDVEKWITFKGYGPIPGVASAKSVASEGSIIGTKIFVENTDGSKHIETITSYVPQQSLEMHISNFTSPMQILATHFVERWEFYGNSTPYFVTRTFQLYPKSKLTFIPLWIISWFLKVAIARHTYLLVTKEIVEST